MGSTHRRLHCLLQEVKASGQESLKWVAIGSFLYQEESSHHVDEPQFSLLDQISQQKAAEASSGGTTFLLTKGRNMQTGGQYSLQHSVWPICWITGPPQY